MSGNTIKRVVHKCNDSLLRRSVDVSDAVIILFKWCDNPKRPEVLVIQAQSV